MKVIAVLILLAYPAYSVLKEFFVGLSDNLEEVNQKRERRSVVEEVDIAAEVAKADKQEVEEEKGKEETTETEDIKETKPPIVERSISPKELMEVAGQ